MATGSRTGEPLVVRAEQFEEDGKARLVINEGDLADAVNTLNLRQQAPDRHQPAGMLFKNEYVREFLAEFLGIFILIVFGNGSVAQLVLSAKPGSRGLNDFFSVNIAYGLAVAFGVYIAGGVSGGHLNPAVTLAFAILKKLKWRKVPVYFAAQYLGAWVASAVIMLIYYDALVDYERLSGVTREAENSTITAGIFASYPQGFLRWQSGLADQIFATMLLMLAILALTDERNTHPQKGVVPILVGLVVAAIGMSFGFNCGYPINPARDLSPRIFTAMAGWGHRPFSVRDYNWFWIPVIGPHIGALLGAMVYKYFVSNHWPLRNGGSEPPLIVHSVTPTGPHYQPLKISQSAYSQPEYR